MLRREIKTLLKILLLALMCLCVFTACHINNIDEPTEDASGNFRVVEPFSFTVDVVNQSRIDIRGINGPIDIVGVLGASQAEIWGERRVTSRSMDDAREYLSQLQVQVSEGGASNVILVKTVQPTETHGRKLEVIYHLRIPSRLAATVNNANGNVLVDSLGGHCSVDLANGLVQVREVSGNIAVRLTNGNVTLANFIGSSSTFVAVVNGNIDTGMTLPMNAECELNTVNGTIGLRIPQNTSAEFSAEVVNGTISLAQLNLQNAVTTAKTMRGRLANGEGQIKLKTVNGSIQAEGF